MLNRTLCESDGTYFFPPLGIGCEACGSSKLSQVTIPASGTIHSTVTVHLHIVIDSAVRFTVAEIALDSGNAN